MDLTERTTSSQTLYKGKIIDLELHDVVLPDGKNAKREIVRHKECVAVLAVDEDENVILVEQYRKPIDSVILEIPAGHIEDGETPELAAKRELLEETGFVATEMTYVNKYYTSPGFSDELIYFFFARGYNTSQRNPDEDEFINVKRLSAKDFIRLIDDHGTTDEKAMLAAYYYQARFM